jgi:hypothetical protein
MTFMSVVRMESLRVLLTIATREDLKIHYIDVITAYLAGELKEEIYTILPHSLPGAAQEVCCLNKGLYTLVVSGPRFGH